MPFITRISLILFLLSGQLSDAFLAQGEFFSGGRRDVDVVSSKKALKHETQIVSMKVEKHRRILMARENYRGRLDAFTADYKGPEHHPPKHN